MLHYEPWRARFPQSSLHKIKGISINNKNEEDTKLPTGMSFRKFLLSEIFRISSSPKSENKAKFVEVLRLRPCRVLHWSTVKKSEKKYQQNHLEQKKRPQVQSESRPKYSVVYLELNLYPLGGCQVGGIKTNCAVGRSRSNHFFLSSDWKKRRTWHMTHVTAPGLQFKGPAEEVLPTGGKKERQKLLPLDELNPFRTSLAARYGQVEHLSSSLGQLGRSDFVIHVHL